jgi:conjugal transfer pilus assembly protein TraD
MDFESPSRPNFEAKSAAVWGVAAIATLFLAYAGGFPLSMGFFVGLFCLCGATYRGIQAMERHEKLTRMGRQEIEFIAPEKMRQITHKAASEKLVWLGHGFDWNDAHSGRLHSILDEGPTKALGKLASNINGAAWMHGLDHERELYMELANLVGHTLVVGTTRVGKTRLFDLLIQQAIFRNEAVIIIDPKGDHGLPAHAKRACEMMGSTTKFVYFHPAHADKSACIDPMRNWNRRTEIASRVATLIPSETGADPFTAFSWKVLNDIANGLIASGEKPNLVELRNQIEGGADRLLQRAIQKHFSENIMDWEMRVAPYLKKYKEKTLEAYVAFYKDVAQHECRSIEVQGLMSTVEHNRDHFAKMVASLIPILSMLTSDPLRELLSPSSEASREGKVVTDMAQIIRMRKVAYLGLDSLADGTVGSAIGSLLLADLTAVAGDRYNYELDESIPVNIFVDEAAEVINDPTIQLMNKAGGANFRVTIATQTFADFAARLGNENKARQVLGNANNKFVLRVLDAETQKYVSDGMPTFMHKSMSIRYGHNSHTSVNEEYSGSYAETLTEREVPLFPPAMLGELPPLHYIARLSGGRTIKGRIPILQI